MEKSQEMVKEITQIRKMTSEIKAKLRKDIAVNIIFAVLFCIYDVLINYVYFDVEDNLSNNLLKIFSLVSILLTVFIFEKAYRKDNSKIAIFGIECFIFSIYCLCIPKVYGFFLNYETVLWIVFPVICIVYYILKSIIIYKKTQFIYQNNLSDIKEIMKDE